MDEKTAIELRLARAKIKRLRGELAAVDAALGEYNVQVLDRDDRPQGAFYQDHGVWIVVEELAKARAEMAQLQTRLVGSQEINASLTHFVLETQAEAVRLQGELDRANGELAARDYAILLAAVELVRQQDEVARLHKVNAALVAAMKMVRD